MFGVCFCLWWIFTNKTHTHRMMNQPTTQQLSKICSPHFNWIRIVWLSTIILILHNLCLTFIRSRNAFYFIIALRMLQAKVNSYIASSVSNWFCITFHQKEKQIFYSDTLSQPYQFCFVFWSLLLCRSQYAYFICLAFACVWIGGSNW